MTTLLNVARHAGVSSATVSRVLNGLEGVSDPVRARVWDSIDALRYEPNRMAQGLKSRRGRTVGFLVDDIEQQWYSTITKQLQNSISVLGLELMLIDLRHSVSRLEKVLFAAQEMGLCAVGFVTAQPISTPMLLSAVEDCNDKGIFVFSVEQDLIEAGIPSVMHNDVGAAEKGVQHLVEAGCEEIIYLGRLQGSVTARLRFEGYSNAISRLGAILPDPIDVEKRYRYDAGYHGIRNALATGRRFDGILAVSDEMALGAMSAINEAGLRVPYDVSIVGFGGMDFGAYSNPPLTTLAGDPARVAGFLSELFSAPLAADKVPLLRIDRELIIRGTVRGDTKSAS